MTSPLSEAVSVFLVEDHPLVRRMLGRLIRRNLQLTLCGEADSAEAALQHIPQCEPKLVLVDVSLPGMDGIELIGILHERYPLILSLALSGHDESIYALPALHAGARGYVMKGKLVQVIKAINHVCRGGLYADDDVLARFEGLE